TWPCIETIGRPRVAAYTSRASGRSTGSAGSARSGCRDHGVVAVVGSRWVVLVTGYSRQFVAGSSCTRPRDPGPPRAPCGARDDPGPGDRAGQPQVGSPCSGVATVSRSSEVSDGRAVTVTDPAAGSSTPRTGNAW